MCSIKKEMCNLMVKRVEDTDGKKWREKCRMTAFEKRTHPNAAIWNGNAGEKDA
jgi:hypothetical protein